MDGSGATAPPPERTDRRPLPHWPGYSPAGVAGAVLFGSASFTPSLLPRDWALQGAVNGLSAVFGYGVGVLLAWAVHAITGWSPSRRVRRWTWILLSCLALPWLAGSLWLGQRWQRQVSLLMGERQPDSYAWIPILLLALALLLLAVHLTRLLRWLVRLLTRRLDRLLPEGLARLLAIVIVVLLILGVNNGLILRTLVNTVDSSAGSLDRGTSPGTSRPTAPQRSGSPASLVPWGSLGRQGRDFVSGGPTVGELTAFSGTPAREPIRVYAGLRSAGSAQGRAALAVRDLRRAGGFGRAVLLVVTSTGTGWVDPAAVDALEYMYDGDTAIVSMQYSYLPSWVAFLNGSQKARQAGRALFDQVYDVWASLPSGDRPELLVFGGSLGAYGAEGAFSGLADLRLRTDGAVLAGPPNFSALHGEFVRRRDRGTPERLPVFQGGREVRFAASPEDLERLRAPWERPRVLYLQHSSDPVVFWSPALAFSRPDWLSEPQGPDVSPDMFWIPVVTFWQVSADLPFAQDVPPGHGHHYGAIFADAWAAVAPPAGWTSRDTRRLRALLAN